MNYHLMDPMEVSVIINIIINTFTNVLIPKATDINETFFIVHQINVNFPIINFILLFSDNR